MARLRSQLPPNVFATWFGKLELVPPSEEDGFENTLCIQTPSVPHLNYIKENFAGQIQFLSNEIAGRPIVIKYKVKKALEDSGSAGYHNVSAVNHKNEVEPPENLSDTDFDALANSSGLHQGLEFDTFVVGKANQVAHSSAKIVAELPGQRYNPFFIYGGVGLGKTHLMHAVGREILRKNPKTKLLCISADRFVTDVVNISVGGHYNDENLQKFEAKYRNLDALLIDDVQFLCQKGGTQAKLFSIMETLLPQNRQLILTCDTYARQLTDFDERLISRMTKGVSVCIEPAEFELRAAILMKKAQQQGVELPEKVAYLIATRLNTNIRELEGALQNVIMRSSIFNRPITEELAKEALQGISGSGRVSIEHIQKTVAEHYKVKTSDMFSKRRMAHIAFPRQVAMYLAKELTQTSLVDIGNAFGGRDHATVLYAVKKIASERAKNEDLNFTLHTLEQNLKSWG